MLTCRLKYAGCIFSVKAILEDVDSFPLTFFYLVCKAERLGNSVPWYRRLTLSVAFAVFARLAHLDT